MKKSKMYFNDTFRFTLEILVVDNNKTALKFIEKTEENTDMAIFGGWACTVGEGTNKVRRLWIRNPKKPCGIVMHECIHTASDVLTERGFDLNSESGGEALCYLAQWCYAKFYKGNKG